MRHKGKEKCYTGRKLFRFFRIAYTNTLISKQFFNASELAERLICIFGKKNSKINCIVL
jgi:hypothetical protein